MVRSSSYKLDKRLFLPSKKQKKAALPRATFTLITVSSPAVLVRIHSGSATFCPYLTVGLVFVLKIWDIMYHENTIYKISIFTQTVLVFPDQTTSKMDKPHKNLRNCPGIRSSHCSSPGLSQNCTTPSPRTAIRSSHGPSS